jgi:hypothetical protein
MFQDKGDIEEHLERCAEVDSGLMFKDGDDVEWEVFSPEVYLLDGVGVAVFLEKWEVAFVEVLDIFGPDMPEDVEGNETAQEPGEEFVVIEDKFEAVVFLLFDRHEYTSIDI